MQNLARSECSPLRERLREKASLVLSCHCEKRSDDVSAEALAKAEAIHLKFQLDCRSRQASFAMTSQVWRFSHSLGRSGRIDIRYGVRWLDTALDGAA